MRARAAITGLVATLVVSGWGCAMPPRPRPVTPPPAAPLAPPPTEPTDDDTEETPADTEETAAPAAPSPCPEGMVLVATADKRFCVDKYEASLVETTADGTEQPYPHYLPVDGHTVRAVSRPDVFPQGFISEIQAQDACAASSKRLCMPDEWKTACMGPAKTTFPYGDTRRPGACHDTGKSAVGAVFGAKAMASSPAPAPPAKTAAKTGKKGRGTKTTAKTTKRTGAATATKAPTKRRGSPAKKSAKPASVSDSVWTQLNNPALGQVEGALAKTGSHEDCVNGFGVFDMVGNLHEWIVTDAAIPHGTFAGGYYLDTALNGDGCNYRTTAHAHEYHDYSTGFRCCAEAGPSVAPEDH